MKIMTVAGGTIFQQRNKDNQMIVGTHMTKKNDILKFIRISVLRPEQLNSILPNLVKTAIDSSPANVSHEEIIESAKRYLLSEGYLEQFVSIIEKIFSHDEVKQLLYFYRSKVVQKYFKNSVKIGPPIYSSLQKGVETVLELNKKGTQTR